MGFAGPGRPVRLYTGVLSAPAGTGYSSAPGNGATVTIFDSTASGMQPKGAAWKGLPFERYQLTILASADSAASGLVVEGSEDPWGTSPRWDTVDSTKFPATYTTASGRVTYDIVRTTAHIRIKYTNSAANLTYWQASLDGLTERARAV